MKTPAILTFVFLLIACYSPLYNKDVSDSAVTTSKLSLDADFFTNQGFDSSDAVYAVASREKNPGYVLVVDVGGGHFNIYVYRSQSVGYSQVAGLNDSYAQVSDPGAAISVLPNQGSPFGFGVYYPQFSSPSGGSSLGVFKAYSANNNFSAAALSTSASSTQILEGFYLDPANGSYLFGSKPYPGGILITATPGDAAMSSTAPVLGTPSVLVSTPAGLGTGSLAVDSADGYYYLSNSESDNGSYETYLIDSGVVSHNPSLLRSWTSETRVQAFLSDGRLVMEGNGHIDVADKNGNVQFQIPAGLLHFSSEFTDTDGTKRCAFTEILTAWSNGDSSSEVRVYSIATSDLSSLKN